MLDAVRFDALLRTRRLGRELLQYANVGSTNDVGLDAIGRQGLLIVAAAQEHGRGRNDRVWLAPPASSLLFSVVVRPPPDPRSVPLMTLAAAVAVTGAVQSLGLAAAHIKWPNDVLVGVKKLCGILCETRTQGSRIQGAVIGVGLNLDQRSDELVAEGTSLRLEGLVAVDRELLLADIVNRLEAELDRLVAGDVSGLCGRWEALSKMHRGHPVVVDTATGPLAAISDGIGDDGALWIRTATGVRQRVLGGGVRFA